MKLPIPTAEQARTIVLLQESVIVNVYADIASSKINAAINAGKRQTYLARHMPPVIRTQLEELGYTLTVVDADTEQTGVIEVTW